MNVKHMTRIVGLLVLCTGGCGTAGLGQAARVDITKQMKTITKPVAQCYKESLQEKSRRMKGSLTLSFKIEPKTGVFKDISVARSSLFKADPKLKQCVIREVSKLKLKKPQATIIGIDNYPIQFSPSN